MSEIILVKEKITIDDLKKVAKRGFGELVKVVVDMKSKIMAIGGEMHADEEAFLIEQGASQDNLWGINIYPDLPKDKWIEFDSMINIRPRLGNRSRNIEDSKLQEKIVQIVNTLITQ